MSSGMYSSRDSTTSLIFIVLFSLCLIGQAASRTCYVCESSINETCYTNVKNGHFQFDCAEIFKETQKNVDEPSEYLRALIHKYSKEYRAGSILNFECVTYIGKPIGDNRVVRMCVPKTENCNAIEFRLITAGFLRHSCNICVGDLCNTHPQEKAPDPVENNKKAESYVKATKSDSSMVAFSCATIFLAPIFLILYQ